ncbi:hypothetical protein [Actinoplanes derwentensis]|uniref:Protein kinase domain-containing protein n=1 Tax=Actinoplanes derwentensis TaxID=113562 RepID=A0A1H2CY55_9ACTN|nr:hypothetical protein [Actinoplanes derwentensis]GID87904.1 hypothetical protein Ade03nite_68280 [Actinoplanes derwentensis]SDT74976.1 hypothetical protein SAMN04489716_7154 [Actinoplanes derwentensis]
MAGIDTPAGYSRLELTSTGADAGVYRAWDERAGRWVVLRLFHRFVGGRSEEAAFAAHVTSAIGLGRNPSIVPVRAGGITATGRPWMALDHIDARPFSEVLRDAPPSPIEAMELVNALADALAWAHSTRPSMVHGWIRPESVLITAGRTPMLTHFSAPRPPGTPAPTPRGDVFGLAGLLFQALTGGPWPGRGVDDDWIISGWPGLSVLLDEVLTPVPAVDTMAVFATRLRQVRHGAGVMLPLPAGAGPEIVPRLTVPDSLPALPVALPAPPKIDEQPPAAYGRSRHLPVLAAALVLLPIGFGVVQLFPGRAVGEAEPVAPAAAVESAAPTVCASDTPVPGTRPSVRSPGDGSSGCDRPGESPPKVP